jgi:hypothetical protein
MDEFTINVAKISKDKKDREVVENLDDFVINIKDQDDGTYLVTLIYPEGGLYQVSILFNGTFQGKAGHIRGSPYRVNVTDKGYFNIELLSWIAFTGLDIFR